MIDIAIAAHNEGKMTRRRPLISAKNPHKCDEQIIPINEEAPRIPFWLAVKFISHCKMGIANAIEHVSTPAARMINPLTKINT